MTKIIAYLEGEQTEGIRNLQDIQVDTSFISDVRNTDTAQPAITVSELNFVGKAATKVITYQKGGVDGSTPGIMEGLPLRLHAVSTTVNKIIFDGFLDFKDYDQIGPNEVVCSITPSKSMNSFRSISNVTYFNILEEKGVYPGNFHALMPYLVEPPDAEAQAASLAITLLIMSVQIAQQIRNIAKGLADVAALLLVVPTGALGSILLAALLLIMDVILFKVLVNEAQKLALRLLALFAPPVRFHKSISQFFILNNAINHLGLSFETNIDEMQTTFHLPGSPREGKPISSGVPKVGQPGQTLGEYIGIMLDMYHAQLAIIGNTVHIRSRNDPFWIKDSTYILPDWGSDDVGAVNLESERKVFNNTDFVAATKISYATDLTDSYTINERKFTDFLVVVEPIDVNDKNNLLFDGLDEINIPMSLGSRKNAFTDIEEGLLAFLKAVDSLINFLPIPGPTSNLAGLISNDRIGSLKLSQNSFNNPKFVFMSFNGGKWHLDANHRKRIAAILLYVKYRSYNSFVNRSPNLKLISTDGAKNVYEDTSEPDFKNQKRLFNDNLMPFGSLDFAKIEKNSYFATNQGERGKIEKSSWFPVIDKASQTYWIEFIWTKNLKERFIELI